SRELRAMVVIPERAHSLARIADAAELVDAGIDVRVVIVLPQARPEEVAGEAVALRRRVAVVQMDGDLRRPRNVVVIDRQVVPETHQRRDAVVTEESLPRVPSVERPEVRRFEIPVEPVER